MAEQRYLQGRMRDVLLILSLSMLACFNFGNPLIPRGPLTGVWVETAQVSCDTGKEVPPPDSIRELNFKNSREFSVTWHPLESYEDYWGTYTFDAGTGALTLKIEQGNYEPPDVDLDGTAAVDAAGRLVLTGIWLGAPQGLITPLPTYPPELSTNPARTGQACAQIFEKWKP